MVNFLMKDSTLLNNMFLVLFFLSSVCTFYLKYQDILLFRGRKFDIRLWVIITSVDPLRIWMRPTGIPKFAAGKSLINSSSFFFEENYTSDPERVADKCVH